MSVPGGGLPPRDDPGSMFSLGPDARERRRRAKGPVTWLQSSHAAPDGEAIIFTHSAPIIQPAKAARAWTVSFGVAGGRRAPRDGSRQRCAHSRLRGLPAHTLRVLGFVHHPASDAGLILTIAEARLREGVREVGM
jgi:hypothetical protein